VPLPLLLYPRGQGYKEGNRVRYNMISIKTLSLLTYFTHIFIDIIIYALGNTSWYFGIFWMVGRVIADLSLGLLSLCGVVPRVPILVRLPFTLPSGHLLGPSIAVYPSRTVGWSGSL
jgi:hypothetical protein